MATPEVQAAMPKRRFGTWSIHMPKGEVMARVNLLYGLIGVLAIAATVLGIQLYRAKQASTGVEISIGDRGISIEKK
jgi:hypothetical protein